MDNQNYRKDLYPEALHLFKKKKITSLDKIRELLNHEHPGHNIEIEDAIVRLKGYRKSAGKRSFIIGVVLLPLGIVAASFLWSRGGILDMALIGALIGGGLGLMITGIRELVTMK